MLSRLISLGLLALARASSSVNVYPPYPVNGTTTTEFTIDGPFDGSKSDFYNSTTWQWWYFDAVSDDLSQSVVIVFIINGVAASGLDIPFNFIETNLAFVDGSQYIVTVPSGSVTITTHGDGADGVMNGTGYNWSEASDLSSVHISIDDPVNNLTGSFKLSSDAPHHAVCGAPNEGASLEVVPNLGWANSIPDANAVVDLHFNGSELKFTGVGYHDSNYGDAPLFQTNVETWYWGHARAGPYSLVWFDTLDTQGSEHQSGYVALNGQALAESCDTITVRPTGQNSTFPPVVGDLPSGFHIVYDMGDEGVLDVNVTNYETIETRGPQYTRWVGTSTGGIRGQEVYEGVALYEWQVGS